MVQFSFKCSLVLLFVWVTSGVYTQEAIPEIIQIGEKSSIDREVTLIGTVKDAESGEVIIGATIMLLDQKRGTVSEADGTFSIPMGTGTYLIEISYLGFSTKQVELMIYDNGSANFNLVKSRFQLDQVIITERVEERNIQSTISGVELLDVTSLQERSQLMGELDVLRSIQTLSGVTSSGDGASGFNVRGGNADENLILQEGALILNPTHTLGFFSLFHPDLIQSVQLYKGNQPSYYGGRLSSVLEVNLREGNKEKWVIGGGIGLAASRITVEGPIKKGSSSILIGGRFSYMDYILNFVKNINVKRSKTFFYDLTAKADARLSENTKIGFTAFLSEDDFQFGQEVNFDYSTKTGSAYLNHLFSDRWNLNFSANYGDYESALFDIQGTDLSRFANGVNYFRSTARNLFQMNDNLQLVAGLSFETFTVRPGSLKPVGDQSSAVPESLPEERGMAWIPFGQLDWDLSSKLSFFAGIRFTTFSLLGPGDVAVYPDNVFRSEVTQVGLESYDSGQTIVSYQGLEPRIGINFNPSPQTAIKMGYHRGYQYLSQISNTASATPIDLWKLADQYIEPQVADNFNLGLFKNFDDHTFETSLEIFYRTQETIIDYKDFPDLLLNQFIERELIFGDGRAYGIETNFKKRTGKIKFDFNYTYSRSERRVKQDDTQQGLNNGEWYPSNYDKPHSLNFNISTKVAPKARLSFAFSYSTGRPVTAPISNFNADNVLNVPLFSERNQFRIPDYHRLDVAYTIGPFYGKKEKSESRIVLSVYNLYSRKNAYSVFFRQRAFQRLSTFRIATLGSIFPSVTFNFKFS